MPPENEDRLKTAVRAIYAHSTTNTMRARSWSSSTRLLSAMSTVTFFLNDEVAFANDSLWVQFRADFGGRYTGLSRNPLQPSSRAAAFVLARASPLGN
jgi:hypothetical protein